MPKRDVLCRTRHPHGLNIVPPIQRPPEIQRNNTLTASKLRLEDMFLSSDVTLANWQAQRPELLE